MKVSDTPYEAFAPYLLGLDVFVGPEAFIARGLEAGAVGAVSALATAFPEHVAAVRAQRRALGEIARRVERFPRHAALKLVPQRRGVPIAARRARRRCGS